MAQVSLPYEIDLPNGKSYTLTYEQTPGHSGYTTARIQRVTLPTGGYYEYDHFSTSGGSNCSFGGVTRIINDGTTSNTWTYSGVASGSNWVMTITAPQMPYDSAANQSTYTFNSSGQETNESYYQGSSSTGTLLRSINSTWSTNASPNTRVTILADTNQQSKVATTYDNNGNLTEIQEYDLGSGAPGSLVRETDMTFSSPSGYGFAPTQKLVKNSSGTVIYREDLAYDESTPTCVTGVTQHDDTNYGCSYTTRGNLTSVTTYTSPATPSGGITKSFTYDVFGNVLTAQVNCCQQKQLNYSSTTHYAYPDSVVSGPSGSGNPQLTKSATYNSYTGAVATLTDENGQVTSYSYDLMGRLTTVTRPDSSQLTTSYDDTNKIVTSTTPVDSSHSTQRLIGFDGLGRAVKTTLEDASSTVYSIVQKQFDPIGRAYKRSNPYTGSSPSYWTESRFDGVGRPVKSILQDSSYSTIAYSGNCATATDPSGKARKSCPDGLGRLSKVFEDPSTLNYETDYTYNLLDELTQVSQGSQTRSYTYDGMGRLTQSTTPEAGTVCIGTVSSGTCQQNGYNNFNMVTTSTDARGVVTNNSYDSLNRLTQVSYTVTGTGVTSTPAVSYTYGTSSSSNNNGRLVSMSDGFGTNSETYTYDILGRMTQLSKVISSATYDTGYSYNLASELTQITYPSGRVVVQTFDAIGRLCSVGASSSTCTSGTRYASGFSYNTAQEVTNMSYGNGIVANLSYSPDRLQLQCLQYDTVGIDNPCTKDSTAKFMFTYAYGSSGSNNGQITGITDGMDSGRNATYSYDNLGRLSRAYTAGSSAYPAWDLSWTYDRYGNRTAQSITSGTSACSGITCPTNSETVSATTNQITGSPYSYDASGNMTNDAYNTLTYDAASRQISASNGSSAGAYVYDGNGLRVKKCVPNCSSPTTTTIYIFSGSKVVAEYDNGAGVTSPSREYVYSGGTMTAKIAGSTTTYYHGDHLSNRLVTDSSGNVVEQLGHFPFGESWYDTGSEKHKFTTYERDAESGAGAGAGNDYAMARYDVNRLGRFSSPDPLSGSVGAPQSLNRYAYTRNDPVNLIDSLGLQIECVTAGLLGTPGQVTCSVDVYPDQMDDEGDDNNWCVDNCWDDWNWGDGGDGGGDQGGGGGAAGAAAAGAAKAAAVIPPWCDPTFIKEATKSYETSRLAQRTTESGFLNTIDGIKRIGPGPGCDIRYSFNPNRTTYSFHTHGPGCLDHPSENQDEVIARNTKTPGYVGAWQAPPRADEDGLWYTDTTGHSTRVAPGSSPADWFRNCPHH
jgi:RHS repeat-associated protein